MSDNDKSLSSSQSIEKLTEEQVNQVLNVYSVLDFSRNMMDVAGGRYGGLYNSPDLINRQMQSINMNPIETTVKKIEEALKNPQDNEQVLRNFATSLELQNMYYKRLIRYNSDMALFNLTYDVKNLQKASELKSAVYKKDLAIFEDFCNRFDFKEEFQKVMRQVLRQGVFYGILRDEGETYTLQELPPDFCMITGRFDKGLLFDFNMSWFLNYAGVDINMYPKVFKKMYRDIVKKTGYRYDPAKKINKRDSTFVYWHQCKPTDGFWAFKANPELTTIVPYYAPLFPEMAVQPIVRRLQDDKYFIEACKLLVGIMGFNKDNKSGNQSNQFNVTPDVLGQFLGLARAGLAEQIGLVTLPVDDVKAVEFDTKERNMLTEYIKNITDQSIASSAALLDDNKLNVHQSKLAAAIDANFVKSFYPMFEQFVEYFVNQKTEKYKFSIRFNDVSTPDDRTERQERFKLLAQYGIVDFQEVARIMDLSPFEFNRRLAISKAYDNEKYLVNLNDIVKGLSGGGTGEVGRPSNPNSDNDNTANSTARGTNELKV